MRKLRFRPWRKYERSLREAGGGFRSVICVARSAAAAFTVMRVLGTRANPVRVWFSSCPGKSRRPATDVWMDRAAGPERDGEQPSRGLHAKGAGDGARSGQAPPVVTVE